MNNLNKIIHSNNVDAMKKMPDNSIDLTVTSPPYGTLRTYKGVIDSTKYNEHFSFPFVDIVEQLFRITKDGGVVVWVINDQVIDGSESGDSFRQALHFMEKGFKLYDTMIYHKNGAAYHEAARYDQVFEYMFVFVKGKKPKTVNIIKDKPNKWAGTKTFGTPSTRQKDGTVKKMKGGFTVSDFGSRYNVWYVVNGKGFHDTDGLSVNHPASYPYSLAEDHILSWSNEGDIVFDPMVGSGTTCLAAKKNNRNYIGIDINEEYVKLTEERLLKVVPYTKEEPNEKLKFIVSREEILEKRKKKK